MAAPMQLGIQISVTGGRQGADEIGKTAKAATELNEGARAGAAGLDQMGLSASRLLLGGAGLYVLTAGVASLGQAVLSLPRSGFDYSKDLEVSAVGMAGILGSMATMHGRQLEYNQALGISQDMIQKLGDDALRTAASSAELTSTFQALLAPGLAARMTLDQIRQLTVVGVNAVKSIGLSGAQVTQELRDLVSGGITAGGSQLATALGLKDADIAKAKASAEGLFVFLMDKLKGFDAASTKFGDTLQGRLDSLKEGAVRAVAQGMQPLTNEVSVLVGEMGGLLVTFDKAGTAQINPQLVGQLREYSTSAVQALHTTRDLVSGVWEHRDAVVALAAGYAAIKTGQWASAAASVVTANIEMANASRLAAVQAAAQGTANVEVAATSRMKIAAFLQELQIQQAAAQAGVAAANVEVAAAEAKTGNLLVTREAIVLSRSEVLAKIEATRTTIAQAEAQIVAARSAGALSFALALAREGTEAVSAAQARQTVLMSELALLGRQQASVQAALAASTAAQTLATDAQTLATNAAAAAAGRLAAANGAASLASGAASLASRGLGLVVGALGGPFGVGIAAVTVMGMWLYKLKGNADDAAEAVRAVNRAEQSLATGRAVRDKDVRNINAQLEAARDKRDDIEGRAVNVAKNPAAQARQAASLAAVNTEIAKYEGLLKDVAAANSKSTTSAQDLTLTLAGSRQGWEASIADAKTATSAQEDYTRKLQASQSAYKAYESAIKASGKSEDEITTLLTQAQQRQRQAETAFAKERDEQLRNAAKSGGDYENLRKTLLGQIAVEQAKLGSTRQLTDAEKDRAQFLAEYDRKVLHLSASDAAAITALHDKRIAVERLQAAEKARITAAQAAYAQEVEWADEVAAAEVAASKAREQGWLALDEYAKSTRESGDAIAFETGLLGMNTEQRAIALAQHQIELDLKKKINEINANTGFDQAQRDDAIARASATAEIAKQGAVAKAQLDTFSSTLQSIDSTGREVFASLFEGGNASIKKLGNSLKTSLIDLLYQMTVRRWVLNIGANVVSSVTGSAVQAGTNAVGSSVASAGSSALGSALGNYGTSAIGASLWGSNAAYGAAIGTTSIGAGSQAAMLAEQTAVFGSEGVAATAAAAGSTGTAALMTAAPYAAAAIAVLSLLGAFGKKLKDSGVEGDFSSTGFSGQSYARYSGGLLGGGGTKTSALDATMQATLGAAYQGVLTQTESYATALGLQTTALDSYVGHIKVSTKGLSAEQATQALQAQLKAQQESLSALALGTERYNKVGESSADALTRLSTSLGTVNNWLKLLDEQALQTSLDGADAASKLAELAGGTSSFASAAQQFYETYTSDADKVTKSQAQMREQLAAVGLALPDSKAGLKELADGLDLTTDTGRRAYAVLLAVAPQFANTLELISTAAANLVASVTGRSGVVPALDTAALSAQGLQAHTLALQSSADAARIDIDALSASLSGVGTAEYVAALDTVFAALTTRLQTVVDAINTERTALAASALQIINPTVMTKDEISRQVGSVNTALPSNGGVQSAQWMLGLLESRIAPIVSSVTYAATGSAAEQQLRSYINSLAVVYGAQVGHGLTQADQDVLAQINIGPTTQAGYGDTERTAQIQNYTAVHTLAEATAAQAVLDYSDALQNFTIDAGKSVTKLTRLREETVKYYEAQAKLASLMTASADNIRKTISDYRLSQMSADDQYGQLAYKFASTYSMVLATTGETAAGYVDKLNAQLSDLIASTNAVDGSTVLGGASASDMIASYLAQASAAAVKMDSGVASLGDYQADSLGLLGSIDATLAALDASTKSAEAIIADAVKAGSDRTASGLQQVINAIAGQPVQAFATGGAFTSGVVSRPTMFDMGLMGEAGPEAILPLSSIGGKLGVHARLSARPSSANDAALLAEISALRAEMAALRAAAERTADNTRSTAVATGTHQRQAERFAEEQRMQREEA